MKQLFFLLVISLWGIIIWSIWGAGATKGEERTDMLYANGHPMKYTPNRVSLSAYPSTVLIHAPHVEQLPELPRGCEVTSLSMLLQHAGQEVDKMELAEKVPKVPYVKEGVHGNPNDGFVGNMYDYKEAGLSVYAGPITKLAEQYMPGQVVNLSGMDLEGMKKTLLTGSPILVILASTYDTVPEDTWQTWTTSSGDIRVSRKIHSVLVTGYDEHFVYVNDPLYPLKHRPIERNGFVTAWQEFGNQAVALIGLDQG
ncbi:C39 family peptidase [Pontibacillus salicampi]|uniref:C39 family peptidase n=1 Tax=Pontibacillus salicampi TaxID=1449801 RepID=A0ABV6LQW5_9BACI